jgi:hypothetical protein
MKMMNRLKRGMGLVVVASMIAALVPVQAMAASSLSGSGTAKDPYLVNSVNDLSLVSQMVAGGHTFDSEYISLKSSLDLSTVSNWAEIGTYDYHFKGTFEGNGHVISNLTITNEVGYSLGLFGYTQGALIEDLAVVNASISAPHAETPSAGIVVGDATDTTIRDVYTTGSVGGYKWGQAGGIAGLTSGTTIISESYSRATVGGAYYNATLVGFNRTTVSDSFGAPTTGQNLIGRNEGTLTNVYTDASVQGKTAIIGEEGNTSTGTNLAPIDQSALTSADYFAPGSLLFTTWDMTNTWTMDPNANDGFFTLVEATGLKKGSSSKVTVATTRVGYTDGSGTISGSTK